MENSGRTVLVVLAARRGDPVPAHEAELPLADAVIAVDSGLHLAERLGLAVDVVIGDLDSAAPDLVTSAEQDGAQIEVHPRDKDHTDLALGLARARALHATAIHVVGGAGGRLDHGLANLMALADDDLREADVTADLGGARIRVVRNRLVTLTGVPGSLVSVIAVGIPARVTTSGLRWDLQDEVLAPTSTRGVSNELLGDVATLRASAGVALAIQPADDERLER